jgi:ribosomal protein L37AE/L43A
MPIIKDVSENPLSCPHCHLSNLVKMPWGEWTCSSCGYASKQGPIAFYPYSPTSKPYDDEVPVFIRKKIAQQKASKIKKVTKPNKELLDTLERERANDIISQLQNDEKPDSSIQISLKKLNVSEIKTNHYLEEFFNIQNSAKLDQIVEKLEKFLNMGSQPVCVRATEILKKIQRPKAQELINSLKNHPDMDVRRIARR